MRVIVAGSVVATSIPASIPDEPPPTASPGGIGIFTGDDPVEDKVILEGELLDGRTVKDVWLTYHQAINDNGDIVFRAIFSDGSQGVYVASRNAPVASGKSCVNQPGLNVPLISGNVQTIDGVDICAMVLASGKYMFSCNPNGPYTLNNLSREIDGTVKRQVYAHGFFPRVDVLPGTTYETVVMEPARNCPNYNLPYNPDTFPGSAGKRHSISGRVLLQSTDMPICAMVLANGVHMFSCDGSGRYLLEFPLDNNGQFKLQVYADGFAPSVQSFDEFSLGDDVRMARSSECR